jgi:signal transduction histidine kinase
MKKFVGIILFFLFASLQNTMVLAADSQEQAIALVASGKAYLKENGREKAFAEFSNPTNKQFHIGDLYLFVYDSKGTTLAHGATPRMIGKNVIDMKDIDGKYLIKDFIEVTNTKGKGWVDYKWPNPVTKAIQQKSSYVEKVDNDLIIGVGIYK